MHKEPNKEQINNLIKVALNEDVGLGDITTRSIVSPNDVYEAEISARNNMVLCGLGILKAVFSRLDPNVDYLDDSFHECRIREY